MPAPNPYAPPAAAEEAFRPPPPPGSVDAYRYRHLGSEAAVRGMGVVFVALASFAAVAASAVLLMRWRDPDLHLWIVALSIAIAVSLTAVGHGLLHLKPWGRRTAVAALLPALLLFPVGTAVAVAGLWALLSRRGREVTSMEYRAVVQATPHIRYRPSFGFQVAVAAILGVLLLLLLWGVVG